MSRIINASNDPMGRAILDYFNHPQKKSIEVVSDIVENDVIPVPYLFRSHDEMPKIEQLALSLVMR